MLALKRLSAYVADFLILATSLSGSQLLISLVTEGWPFNQFRSGLQIELWVLCTMSLPAWTYFIIYEFRRQQTIGKRLFRLQVVLNNGGKITFWQACLRTFIKILPWELTHLIVLVPVPWWEPGAEANNLIYIPNVLLLIYIICLFWTDGRKAPHDFISDTQVNETLQ